MVSDEAAAASKRGAKGVLWERAASLRQHFPRPISSLLFFFPRRKTLRFHSSFDYFLSFFMIP